MVQRLLHLFFYSSGIVLIVINQCMDTSLTTDYYTFITGIFVFWYSIISFNDAVTSLAYCSKKTLYSKLYSGFLILYAASLYALLILYVLDPDSAWFISTGLTSFNSCTYYGREVFERLQPTEINNEINLSKFSVKDLIVYCYKFFRDIL